MSQFAWIIFLGAALLGFGFFGFARRQFDFLSIAYIGAMFYFSPLIWGRVTPASPAIASTIQPVVYLIATAYVLGLVLAGILSQRLKDVELPTDRSLLSVYYLALAVLGLLGSIVSTRGAIFNVNKIQVLEQVGYFYVLFEVAASLTCISAVVERRWWTLAAGGFLLSVDLLVGFRPFVLLTSLSVTLVLLVRHGRIRIYSKAPTYGLAAVALVAGMLLVHSARIAIFDKVAEIQRVPASEGAIKPSQLPGDGPASKKPIKSSQMRSDTIQYDEALDPTASLLSILLRLFKQSEPSVIQATLVGVVQTHLSCRPSNIFKSFLILALPPGMAKFLPSAVPPSFYDEYQPVLYPNLTYGTGGNIWAEMLCRFGYPGVAVFGLLLILVLAGLHGILRKSASAFVAPIAFGGAVLAFYIHRNDVNYTLVMLRQIGIVFAVAYGLSLMRARLQAFGKYRPERRAG